jgi:hypothetical protein
VRTLRGCALALVAVSALVVSSGSPSSAANLPSRAAGCGVVSATSPPAIPFAASGSGSRVPMVSVCIDGHGPYPFVVSSGAGVSVVAPRLARSLQLPPVISVVSVLGVTCRTTAREVLARKWSLGGLGLATQGLLVAPVPSAGLQPAPMGIIGSDVLARFQAIQFDYRSHHLRPQYAESLPPRSTAFVIGEANTKPPSGLQKGRPTLSVPLTMLIGPSGTTISAPVAFGSPAPTAAALSFNVDSGSARSSVVRPIAATSSLQPIGGRAAAWGAGCSGTVPQVQSGSWSVDKSPLAPQTLSVATIAGGVNQAVDGVLGADVLASAGSYVIDYQHAHLWVGGRR